MVKLLILAAAIVAVSLALPIEKRRVPMYKLLAPRDPFPKRQTNDTAVPSEVTLLRLEQRVDNFNPQNLATWDQWFYRNNEFYTPGGPMFVFLGGEWRITDYRLTNSLMYNMASSMNASIFYLEHRYYGESRPTPDVSDENLRFLTPEQALADAAHFVNYIRSTEPGAMNSEIILVGGHYSASLAVWFRQRFPHLSIGVWASSAPLPSFVDFDQFKVATGLAYRTVGGDSCYNALELGFDRMHELFDAGDYDTLTEEFFLCDPLEPEDAAHFFSLMAEFYAILPQFEFEEFIEAQCAHIEEGQSSLESIAYILNFFIDTVGGECIDIDYDAIIDAERQTEWDSPAVVVGYRQWTYQLCSQIGWFHTSGATDQPFGDRFPDPFITESFYWASGKLCAKPAIYDVGAKLVGKNVQSPINSIFDKPFELYHAGCQAVFGDDFTEERLERNSDRFNTLYGGLEPDVSNAIFTHGQHDPWGVIGRRTNLSDDAVAIIIPRATMANDLGPRHPDNPPELVAAKNQVESIIRGWLGLNDIDD